MTFQQYYSYFHLNFMSTFTHTFKLNYLNLKSTEFSIALLTTRGRITALWEEGKLVEAVCALETFM